MAKKQRQPTADSAVHRDLRSPKYQMRVVQDKTRYSRKRAKATKVEDFRQAA